MFDPVTNTELVITGEGDCATVDVTQRFGPAGSSGQTAVAMNEVRQLDYVITPDCYVEVLPATVSVLGDPSGGDELESETAVSADPEVAGVAGVPAVGNYIHSSQTMQDVVNIDIAKFEYSHDRVWYWLWTHFKGCCGHIRGSTSVPWNHPNGVLFDGYDGSWRILWAWGFAHGRFHTDFLWCNIPGQPQDFNLITVLVSLFTGSYAALFDQTKRCGGTHMSTRYWTSISPPWWV